jgi:lipopolysaccharide biosynthesis glycosyltransferase
MKIEVITSFNKRYYDLIGKDCVESWLRYWPRDLSLTCYVEEFKLPEIDRINQISFEEFDDDYNIFQSSQTKQVQKFAKKAFSFIHSMFNSDADRIVWIDADVITTDKIEIELIKLILPDNALSTHMGVVYRSAKDGTPGRWFVPETGFFAVNTKHEDFDRFRSEYRRHYVEQDYKNLRRFYDNDVYGYVFEKLGSKGYDLCDGLEKEYKTPLRHTVLGPYLSHYKAKHSKAGYTTE